VLLVPHYAAVGEFVGVTLGGLAGVSIAADDVGVSVGTAVTVAVTSPDAGVTT
jgi:hypothetical protein